MIEQIDKENQAINGIPLCVDLDETLIRTDILWESVVQLWQHPILAIQTVIALMLHGKAALKTVLAEAIKVNPALLPYREDVLDFIREQHKSGREIVLATATHLTPAQAIGDYLGIFSKVFATEETINLSGRHKQTALEAVYGKRGFDYIGDSNKDLPIFSAARESLLVDPSKSLLSQASSVTTVSKVFITKHSRTKTLAKAMRLHQWAKNALLAVPLLTAHLMMDIGTWVSIGLAFIAFGLVASSTYLVNDLVDLQSDRAHARKRFRPLASGMLSIPAGILLAIASAFIGGVIAVVYLPASFVAYLVLYVVLTLAYSFKLKRKLIVDVLALAVLYTLRILAGGVAIGVVVSEWLLMFSLFIFLSLAFLKRAIELMGSKSTVRIAGRGYSPSDLDTVRMMGISSGMISVLVLALYISSPAVSQLYRSPHLLSLICPLIIYWIGRIWFLAARGEVDHDPVVFALFDWRSYVVGTFGLGIAILATIDLGWIH